MTIVLLQIALVTPATNVTYVFFVTMLYIGFPFTVISQVGHAEAPNSAHPTILAKNTGISLISAFLVSFQQGLCWT